MDAYGRAESAAEDAGPSTESIVSWYYARKNLRAPEVNMAMRIKQAYNGDIVLPTAELTGRDEKAAISNQIKQAINQNAVRAASTLPTLWCPPTRVGIKKAADEADQRRRVMAGWWEMNDFKVLQARRMRHFIAYASSPVSIRWDFGRGIPVWQVRDPLATFPAPTTRLDDMEPCDCIFTFQRSWSWMVENYPLQAAQVKTGMANGEAPPPDTRFDILEFVDDDVQVLIVLGRSSELWSNEIAGLAGPQYQGHRWVELERVANKAGVCTAIVPGRVTLDKPQGQFDGMLAIFIKRARLAALQEIAVEKAIFENEWFIDNTGGAGEIVTVADGREGIVGHVKGGTMEWHTIAHNIGTDSAIDRTEREGRLEGPLPADMQGESASNVRTDRRGNTIMSSTVDFQIAETHDIFAASHRKELARAVACAKGFAGDTPKSFYVTWKGAKGPVVFKPNVIFADTDQVVVRWAMPGADVNGLTVGGLQRVGANTLSSQGFMEFDPLIDDVEEERDRITVEGLNRSLLSALEQQAQAGALPPADLARIVTLVATNQMELAEAVDQVHKEAQARQATQAPAGAPETQPGIAQPGQGAEQPPAAMGPTADVTGLSALATQLRRGQVLGSPPGFVTAGTAS